MVIATPRTSPVPNKNGRNRAPSPLKTSSRRRCRKSLAVKVRGLGGGDRCQHVKVVPHRGGSSVCAPRLAEGERSFGKRSGVIGHLKHVLYVYFHVVTLELE